jgi:hypothetical protein
VFEVGVAPSVAFTEKVEVPAVVGVPLSEQLLLSVKPAGTEPLARMQLYGAVPPATPTEPLYGVFTVPDGGLLSVSVTVEALIVRLTAPVEEIGVGDVESVAFTVKFEVPAVDGVPVSEQLLLSVSPAGSVPLTSEQL